MTDATLDRPTIRRPDLSAKRLGKRYAAEKRFQLYGILAILAAVLMLGVLLVSIVAKGYSAFAQTEIALEIHFDPAELDPDGTGDPEVIGRANFQGLINEALYREFPGATGDRQARRALRGLVSSGANFELRRMVMENPAVIGTTRTLWFRSSDDVDVFLKGEVTDIEAVETRGRLSLSETGDEIELSSDADDFAGVLAAVKRSLAAEADEIESDAAREASAVAFYESELERLRAANASSEEIASAEASLASHAESVERLAARVETLRARAAATGGSEELDDELPSFVVSANGGVVKLTSVAGSRATGRALIGLESAAPAAPGAWQLRRYVVPEASRRLSDEEVAWIDALEQQGKAELTFASGFFTSGDSREPELAGIWGAAVGSFYTLIVTLILSFPVGVLAAVYLEEFAPKNRITDLIEVNINNLAAVPSIVFGLLGLAVFLNFFGLPRSAPLVGGMVLALMTLPTIIIAARAALKAVPPSIREAALGIGASRIQTVTHHVLPLAMPGVLTGTIIGMAQALGETAPLLMIGMVAFIVDIPGGFTDPATVLPVQIYLWADAPERAFVAKTSAAIMVLLGFLVLMNALAVYLRKRFERRW